jgi:16S rRNA (adenine1518-N6/adenine1519-N6)-dimethyltransferase
MAPRELPLLNGIVRAAFGQRRKTLANALANWLRQDRNEIERFLHLAGIDPTRRGETLSAEEFFALTRALQASQLLPAEK